MFVVSFMLIILIFSYSPLDACCDKNLQDFEKIPQKLSHFNEEANPIEDFTYLLNDTSVEIISYIGLKDHVKIPQTINDIPVKYIGDNTFLDNTNIKSIIIPKQVYSIGKSSFKNCINLSEIELPESLSIVYASAFENCQSFKSILFGQEIRIIDNYALRGCTSLEAIQFKGDAPSLGNFWISNTADNLTIYYVEGKKKFDSSPWKNLNTVPLKVLDAPTGVYVTPGESVIEVSWEMSNTVENKNILGFNVYYKKSEDVAWMQSYVKDDLAGRIENLCNGVDYEVCVSAVNIAGTGNQSEIVTVTPFTISEAPVLVVNKEDSEIFLTWNAPNNMGSTITEYHIYQNDVRIKSQSSDEVEYRVKNPEEGFVYIFKVSASNSAGESMPSNQVEVFFEKTYTISFDAGNGIHIESLTLKTGDGITPPIIPCKEGYLFAKWSPAIPEVMPEYNMTVIAVWDTIVDIPVPAYGLCYTGEYQVAVTSGKGYELSGEYKRLNVGEYVADLSLKEGFVWNDGTYETKELWWEIGPKTVYVYPGKDQYKCYSDEDADLEYYLSKNVDVFGKLHRVSGEDIGVYEIDIGSLKAEDDNYCLKMDGEIVHFTIITKCPGAPTALDAIFDDIDCVELQWRAPDFEGGCEISCYEVWMKKGNDVEWMLYEIVENQESCDVLLDYDTSYDFAVKAVNSAGVSEFSDSVSIEIKNNEVNEEVEEDVVFEGHEENYVVFITSFILVMLLCLVLMIPNKVK